MDLLHTSVRATVVKDAEHEPGMRDVAAVFAARDALMDMTLRFSDGVTINYVRMPEEEK